jgi:membrane peptidoglycan carboxypeptidase
MGSATLRAYMDGEDTRNTRRNIALDYINTVPLAARGGFGEVNGIGDGLRVWYDADVKEVNTLLQRSTAMTGNTLAAQALAYKQVLSLFLAQRRPSYYLGGGEPNRLNELANVYLELLAQDKVIRPELRAAAASISLRYGPPFSQRNAIPYASDKAVNVARTRLTTMLGLKNLYEMDRIDLSVNTTFDQAMQKIANDTLRKIKDPEAARAAGLFGERLLSEKNDLSKVIYSFTLMERTPTANLVRIQADNLDQPFDINEGVKLDLGSSAKLRTLVSYLNIIEELHEQYGKLSAKELAKVNIEQSNVLARWAVDYLRAHPKSDLAAMLSAAMDRKYSASPYEQFYTGGGVHTFDNFDKLDNNKIVTVREAIRNSINLPFVRMMRDIVRYHMRQVPGSTAKLLDDVHDERRSSYLARFAEQEGSTFIHHFYRKYKGKTLQESQELLHSSASHSPSALAILYNSIAVAPDVEEFTKLLRERLPGNKFSAGEITRLFEQYNSAHYTLPDQGYIARIHPLELWTAAYLTRNPNANSGEVLAASAQERQDVYNWLRKTRHKNAQDIRILQLLEMEAFLEIHKEWESLGYPFDSLVPSYATSIGSSADRPAALAELMGILVNDGVRLPTVRVESLHFAADTPYETVAKYQPPQGEQVLNPVVVAEVRKALRDVVENGTARRLQHPFTDAEGNIIPIGGKTGTGDDRREIYGSGGQLIDSTVMNRTATFVFYIGDRYFGTITAFVPGVQAKDYKFTSGLPVQLFKTLAPVLEPYLMRKE